MRGKRSSLGWKDLSMFETIERKYVETELLIAHKREGEGKISMR